MEIRLSFKNIIGILKKRDKYFEIDDKNRKYIKQ